MTDAVAIAAFVISTATFCFNIIWAPFVKRQSEQIKLALEFKRQYVLDYQGHLDRVYAYKAAHDSADVPYWLYWQRHMAPGLPDDSEEKRVDNARRALGRFWDEVFEFYHAGALPMGACHPLCGPKSILTGNFLRKAQDFQSLVEPLDCANWYRLGIFQQSHKDGTPKGDYGAQCRSRPNWYTSIDDCHGGAGKWHEDLDEIAERCRTAASV